MHKIPKFLGSGVIAPLLQGGLEKVAPIPKPTKFSMPKQIIGNKKSTFGYGNLLNMADLANGLIPLTESSTLTKSLDTAWDTASNAVSAIPGIGTLVGGIMKGAGLLSDGLSALGVGTDLMTVGDLILDSKFLKWTPFGLVNAIGAKTADTIEKDEDTFNLVGSSYTGSESKVDDALEKSGKKYGLFSNRARKKANEEIFSAKDTQSKVGNIAELANLALMASNNPLIGLGTLLQLGGGYQQNTVRAGKSGIKMDREFAQRVIKLSKGEKSKTKKSQEVAEFKNGGAVNVIPDGALHKNKHHLENVDEKFEDVTTKGIPVITESKGGDITQHAEVEREEIIFNLEVTQLLEKLMKEDSDDAAIEAGKLLVREILENTVDNTGLLKSVK